MIICPYSFLNQAMPRPGLRQLWAYISFTEIGLAKTVCLCVCPHIDMSKQIFQDAENKRSLNEYTVVECIYWKRIWVG